MNTEHRPFQDVPSVLGYFRTGSRETVDPPPLDTDEDWVLLTNAPTTTVKALRALGYTLTSLEEYRVPTGDPFAPYNHFQAFRRVGSAENLILVTDNSTFTRWKVATRLAKRLNIKNKEDRIALFRAIRSGGLVLE